EVVVIQDWAKYDYENKYMELIYGRKLSDHIEGADKNNKQSQYLPYFYRYEDSLVMPLPELVAELGGYPQITKLKSILDTIDRLEADKAPKQDPSSLLNRLKQNKSGRKEMWNPGTAQEMGTD